MGQVKIKGQINESKKNTRNRDHIKMMMMAYKLKLRYTRQMTLKRQMETKALKAFFFHQLRSKVISYTP